MRGRSIVIAAAAVCALLCLPAAASAPFEPVTVLDLFAEIPVNALAATAACTMGQPPADLTFDAQSRSFHFAEASAQGSGLLRQGYASCATVRYDADIPPGTHHIHIRFTADRGVNEQVGELSHNLTQALLVSFDGAPAIRLDYFSASDDSRPPTRFDPPSYPVPEGAGRVAVTWLFADQGGSNQVRNAVATAGAAGASLPNPTSTHTFNATVRDPVIEFSGPPRPATVRTVQRVAGEREETQTRVLLPVEPSLLDQFAVNLRVEVDSNLTLSHVLAPDGTRLTQFTSNPLAGTPGFQPYNPNGLLPVVEPRADFYRATLPGEAVQQHGAGTYTFVFVQSKALDASPPALAVAFAVLLAPFVIGAVAARDVQSFRREAFGLYKKAATGLLGGVLLVLAYYLAFVAQALLQSQHLLMAQLPPTGRGGLLFLHVVLAIAALVAFGISGRRLHNITRPATQRDVEP